MEIPPTSGNTYNNSCLSPVCVSGACASVMGPVNVLWQQYEACRLVAIAGATNLVPRRVVKSLQLILYA